MKTRNTPVCPECFGTAIAIYPKTLKEEDGKLIYVAESKRCPVCIHGVEEKPNG